MPLPPVHTTPEGRETVSIEDLRDTMTIQLTIYHKAFLDQKKSRFADPKDVVEALTKGWEDYEVTRPTPDYRPPFEAWIGS